ncbi:hypothetical protein OGATHE_000161 [Ogataea polymorpha]|uniref:Uncharacterized protein n=1 Tax=Ogataea polymorpha TaxID=460523 RepID=A0A9P8PUL6_9ASCO|nr:hypothetical protein OGATHE_000161 [Ogataea polymorpha]
MSSPSRKSSSSSSSSSFSTSSRSYIPRVEFLKRSGVSSRSSRSSSSMSSSSASPKPCSRKRSCLETLIDPKDDKQRIMPPEIISV